ncbi:MAG: amidohydrolase [Steroidobacteraceae bacterium]
MPQADVVLRGEHIITMEPDPNKVRVVAVKDDRIVYTGADPMAQWRVGPGTRIVDLDEQALVPGLIDAHGHFSATASTIDFVNLASPPVGRVRSIGEVIAALKDRLATKPPAPGKWLLGFGYDDSLLQELRHPDRDDLDQVSAEVPILIMHVSGHLAAVNSAALAAAGIDAKTPDPAGGVIRRRAGNLEPNGVLEEAAAMNLMRARTLDAAGSEFARQLDDAAELYASHGITTAQDGAISPAAVAAYRATLEGHTLPIDVVGYVHSATLDRRTFEDLRVESTYHNGFRVGGIKFTLDGSPQGRTAWLSQPYDEGPPGVPSNYVAYPTMLPDEYRARVAQCLHRKLPVLVHANGDAAIDLLIDGVRRAITAEPAPDHRTVAIHAQLMRADQLDAAKELGIVPSFFSAHTFFWGDWHLRSFGTKRGENISPTGWARQRGMRFTVHNDAPVVPPDMMRLLWATVNRQTRSGHLIGAEQRISALEALRAMTLDAAWQYFEEDEKGSIAVGKRADLVILGADPTDVAPDQLADIEVIETFARGRSVYRRPH